MNSPFIAILSIIFILLVVMAVIALAKLKGVTEYDERQRAARGAAFAAAYFTLICYGGLAELFEALEVFSWADSSTNFYIGLCVSLVVFCITCIAKDAYTSPRINPVRNVVALALIGGANLFMGLMRLYEEPMVMVDGALTGPSMNLCLGVSLLICTAAMLIRLIVRSHEEKVDE